MCLEHQNISGLSKTKGQSSSYAEVDEDVQSIKNYHKSILPEVQYSRQQGIVPHLTIPRDVFINLISSWNFEKKYEISF